MTEGVTRPTTAGGTLGDGEHGVGDQDLQVGLEEPGESGKLHGLCDEFHPGGGAVNEEGILGVRRRHAEQYLLNSNKIKLIPSKKCVLNTVNRTCNGSVV